MIIIKPSPTADTRTCDFANTTKETLLASSHQHIADVREGLRFLGSMLAKAAENHDFDKITDIEGFHRDFVTGFAQTEWWDKHRVLNRHHLNNEDGVRDDVNLIDVMDFIVDCVMAGMARSGSVYPLELPPELLERAFQNTAELLKRNVIVVPPEAAMPDPTPETRKEAAEQFENEILAPPIARALAEAEEKWRKEAQDYIAERCYCVCHTPVASRSSCEHCKGVNEVTYTNVKRWGDALEAERDRLKRALAWANAEKHGAQADAEREKNRADTYATERDRLREELEVAREALEFALEALGDPDDANKRLAAVLKGNAALPKEGA